MRTRNKISAIALLLFFALSYFICCLFPPQAGSFPKMVNGAGILFSAILLLVSVLNKKEDDEKMPETYDKMQIKMIAITVICLIVYVFILPLIGYKAATIIYIFIMAILTLLKKRTKMHIIVYSIIAVTVSVLLYVVFAKMLYIPLPMSGLLG